MDLKMFALNLIRNNPNIANNPQAQEYINVIQNGDEKRGIELANNICKSYGTTPQDALANARAFFKL